MIFVLSFISFWLVCSYLTFAGTMTFWCVEFRNVGDVDEDFRDTLFMSVLGGPMGMLALFLSFRMFKHGINWRKEARIKRSILELDEFKRNM